MQIVNNIHMHDRISARVKEERKRLCYGSQGALAERLGISLGSVHNYEAGKRLPETEFLLKFSEVGGDVLYILTGTRAAGVISDIEARLINAFRASPEAVRDAIMAALQAGAASAPATPIATPVEQLTAEKSVTPEDRKALEEKAGIRPRSDAGVVRKGRSGGR